MSEGAYLGLVMPVLLVGTFAVTGVIYAKVMLYLKKRILQWLDSI